MKITIAGAGPAGLYAAILIRRMRPDIDITVLEQNPADATFGFGVVFSDEALDFLRADDPETAELIAPQMTRWSDIALVHRGERVVIDGVGFSGIGRLELLRVLQGRAADLGIHPRYNTRLTGPADLPECDLAIAADGLNSVLRSAAPDRFGATVTQMSNRFVWYGCAREFDALTQTFVETPVGRMNAHHYTYAPGRGTFIVEMTDAVFERAGFADMAEPEYRRACAGYFAETLAGAPLIANNSAWRRFPDLACEKWYDGKTVLVGDALHTAHFSIGSGTRLALEDVIALVRALVANEWSVADALPAYQAARAPVLAKIQGAARRSAEWYEAYDRHMDLEPWPFALSYIRRAGRLSPDRLRKLAPRFTQSALDRGLNLEVAA
ncbi:MAG: FAD-dependent monooxygenase [Rhodobacteraceae bacterium]|nr:FAD-dependent monooxygenase [Paracoccaceae bacterium]